MTVKKISKSDFNTFVDGLIASSRVIGVQAKGERFNFAPLKRACDLKLDYDVTLQSPKKFFQPTKETLLTYSDSEGYKSHIENEPFILIGVHPYDMIAINQMDKVFSQDNYDSHYFARRQAATIIACDVVNASDNVFASSMGTATVTMGFDILLTDVGDCFVGEAATEKGEALLAKAAATDASKADQKARQQIWQKNTKELNKHKLKCDPSDIPGLLEEAYDSPVWDEKAKICFACGSCNQVCPTCYCFNVTDDVNWDLQSGKRDRAWDGCLLNGFTKVAGDHEFRNVQANRIRHRLYRKGKYVADKLNGQIACVGCGRCASACLTDIANPVKIYNRLIEEKAVV